MKKNQYIKPEIVVTAVISESLMGESRFSIDGSAVDGDGTSTPIIEDDPEIIYSKKHNLWDDWED